jgi:hypothetical protein
MSACTDKTYTVGENSAGGHDAHPQDLATGPGSTADSDAGDENLKRPCPPSAAWNGFACTNPGLECRYESRADGLVCGGGYGFSLCACVDGRWSCFRDICKSEHQASPLPPPRCQGKCSELEMPCRWVAKQCPSAPDIAGVCRCDSGTWLCGVPPGRICLAPLTCVSAEDGCTCVIARDAMCLRDAEPSQPDAGSQPPDSARLVPCRNHRCAVDAPRPPCIRDGVLTRAALCVFGQWTCPPDWTLAQCRA